MGPPLFDPLSGPAIERKVEGLMAHGWECFPETGAV